MDQVSEVILANNTVNKKTSSCTYYISSNQKSSIISKKDITDAPNSICRDFLKMLSLADKQLKMILY